jgi:hypothetical protein
VDIRVTIEIQGSPAEVAAWLSQLPGNGVTANVAVKPSDVEWTPELATRFVQRISPRAREAVWHMTQHAPTISFTELQDAMQTNGLGLGGILASVGFGEKAGIPRPYVANHVTREYEMDPTVAEVVAEALEAFR